MQVLLNIYLSRNVLNLVLNVLLYDFKFLKNHEFMKNCRRIHQTIVVFNFTFE